MNATPIHMKTHVWEKVLPGHTRKTGVSGPVGAGEHRLAWDGRRDDGRVLAAGVYPFRLEVELADGRRTVTRGRLVRAH